MGTIPVGVDLWQVPQPVLELIDRSPVYIGELDLRFQQTMSAFDLADSSPSIGFDAEYQLKNLMPKADWKILKEFLQEAQKDKQESRYVRGFMLDNFEEYAPITALNLIMMTNAMEELDSTNSFRGSGKKLLTYDRYFDRDILSLDGQLQAYARKKQKTVVDFGEDATHHRRDLVLGRLISIARVLRTRSKVESHKEMIFPTLERLQKIEAAYLAGDGDLLNRLSIERGIPLQKSDSLKRSKYWAPLINKNIAKYGAAFISVDTHHLIDPTGSLLKVLQSLGYQVKRMEFSKSK